MDKIIVKGARENNLKNVNIELPKNKLIVMTGFVNLFLVVHCEQRTRLKTVIDFRKKTLR